MFRRGEPSPPGGRDEAPPGGASNVAEMIATPIINANFAPARSKYRREVARASAWVAPRALGQQPAVNVRDAVVVPVQVAAQLLQRALQATADGRGGHALQLRDARGSEVSVEAQEDRRPVRLRQPQDGGDDLALELGCHDQFRRRGKRFRARNVVLRERAERPTRACACGFRTTLSHPRRARACLEGAPHRDERLLDEGGGSTALGGPRTQTAASPRSQVMLEKSGANARRYVIGP